MPTFLGTLLSQSLFHPEDGGSNVFWNVGIVMQHSTALKPEDLDFHLHFCENLKSVLVLFHFTITWLGYVVPKRKWLWTGKVVSTYLLTYLPTYQPINKQTPRSRVLLQKLTVTQVVKKFSAFYGTRKFTTMFTTPRHWSLSWARRIHSTPSHSYFQKTQSNINFPSMPRSSEWSLTFRFSDQNFVCISRLSQLRYIRWKINTIFCIQHYKTKVLLSDDVRSCFPQKNWQNILSSGTAVTGFRIWNTWNVNTWDKTLKRKSG
jgi:hypothetical protein